MPEMPNFPTNEDRITANAIATALNRRYGAVAFSVRYWAARTAMDTCAKWAAKADARCSQCPEETACTRCGRPMNPAHAGTWVGPNAPRHGNCANYTEGTP